MRLNKKVGVVVGALLSLVVSLGVADERTPRSRTELKDVKGREGSSTEHLSEKANEDETAVDLYYSGSGEVTAKADHWYVTFTNLQPPVSFALSSTARLKNFPLDQTIVGEVSIDLIGNLTHGVAWIVVDACDTTKSASLKLDLSEVQSIGRILRQAAEVETRSAEGRSTDHLSDQVIEDANAFDTYFSGFGEVTARTDHWYVTFTNLQPPISFALSSSARLKNFPLDQTIVGQVSLDLIDNLTHGVAWIDVDTGDTTITASLKVARSEVLSVGKVLRQTAEVITRPADGATDEGGVAGLNCACASCCTCDGKCGACCETGWQPQCSCEGAGRCRCVPPPD